MTRVLFVIPSLGSGGAERSLADEFPGLLERGIDPVVACFYDRAGFRDEVEALGVPVHILHGTWPTHLDGVRRMISAMGPDLVHTSVTEADLVGRLAAFSTRTPVVSTLVNTAYDKSRLNDPGVTRLGFEAYRWADSWTARRCVGHRAISETVKATSIERMRLQKRRITVIPRGRDLRAYHFTFQQRIAARNALGVEPSDFVVGNVARHEYQKGLDTLVTALARVMKAHPEVRLVQAGRTGNHTEAIQSALRRSDADPKRFAFLGARDDIAAAVLPALDLFVFPSRYEGLGGAVLEAMAAGLPIVASDLPVLREVLGSAAAFAPPEDPVGLAQMIATAARDRALPPLPSIRALSEHFDISLVASEAARWLHDAAQCNEYGSG